MKDTAIAYYAHQAGIPDSQIPTAVAIALAETGGSGNPSAYNGKPPDNSYGLWQINMIGDLGPARQAKYGLSSYNDLFNPAVNAKAMADISGRGSNWGDWTTYTGGAYRQYLTRGQQATQQAAQFSWQAPALGVTGDLGSSSVPQTAANNPVTDAINSALGPVGGAIQQAATDTGKEILGIAEIAVGVILMLVGAVLLGFTVAGGQPARGIASAVPAGRALKAAGSIRKAAKQPRSSPSPAASPRPSRGPSRPRGGTPRKPRMTAKRGAEAGGIRWSELNPQAKARFTAAYRARGRR